jgi:D-alanyl-lipoteichoic acid acyltransferase DltB (MBOAT superfamily)
MTIDKILILIVLALLVGLLRRGRGLMLLVTSTLVIFWLQPAASVQSLVFWLPAATLALVVLAWVITSPPEVRALRSNWPAGIALAAVILLVDLNRYFGLKGIYTTATPRTILVLFGLVAILLLVILLVRLQRINKLLLVLGLVGLILAFIVLKSPSLTTCVLSFLMTLRGRTFEPKTMSIISWLGFSYIAFRLMHTIRDRQTGRLPAVTLAEYVNYMIFFPSFTAGPIDRLERFVQDLRQPLALKNEDWLFAGQRLVVGLFKKFVLADALALISITDILVGQVRSSGWLWVVLYAYALRIYFDFSGYTDIAIGLARLLGVRLPENFAAPYLKPNLTQFWNSWHMTLTQWFRAYFFNPLTRSLRSGKQPLPVPVIVLITQLSTMVLIGLWHGITWNFVLWGLWHGVGLFVHNRWSEMTRGRFASWVNNLFWQRFINVAGTLITFHYVTLGWVFFALSSPRLSWHALFKLFGLA